MISRLFGWTLTWTIAVIVLDANVEGIKVILLLSFGLFRARRVANVLIKVCRLNRCLLSAPQAFKPIMRLSLASVDFFDSLSGVRTGH